MNNRAVLSALAVCCLLASCSQPNGSRSQIDSAVDAELTHTRSIDNHAHPKRALSPGEVDNDYDALPANAIQEPGHGNSGERG